MIRLTATDARYALFASALQQSDQPSAQLVTAAIDAAIAQFGLTGCVSRMAEEYGDHPETASERMRWAGQITGGLAAFATESCPA
jgi:hypothetical protein